MGNTFTDGVEAAAAGGGSTTVSSANILSRTRVYLAEETADFFDDIEIFRELNAGMRMLFGNIEVLTDTGSISAVDGTATYALDTNFKRMIQVRYGQDDILNPIDERQAGVFEYQNGSEEGQPRYYELYVVDTTGVSNIRLHPTPDASYTLPYRFYCFPPALVSGGQGPAWHTAWAYIPCLYAAAILLEKDRRTAGAADKMQLFEARKRQYEAEFEASRSVEIRATYVRDTRVPRPMYPSNASRLTIP